VTGNDDRLSWFKRSDRVKEVINKSLFAGLGDCLGKVASHALSGAGG
jgi:hypothetical protein